MKNNDNVTLEELEKDVWPEPEFRSYLVTTCHQLRRKQLGGFTVEDLRIMIGQGIGLRFLLPKALEVLKKNPFASGDFCEGDLLVQVLRVDRSTLTENKSVCQDLIRIGHAARKSVDPVLSNEDRELVDEFLKKF